MWAKHKQQAGFTIVELLIVIVVIAVLAAISVVAYNGITARASFTKSKSDMNSLNKAILIFYADKGYYPIATDWMGWDQATGDSFIPGLAPQYISATPQMPVANVSADTYLYRSSTGGAGYQLMRYKDTGLPSIELGSNLASSPQWTTTGWGYKSDNMTWN